MGFRVFCFIILSILSLSFARENATLTYYLPDSASYNQSISTPRSYLGYQIGEWHIQHHQLTGYLEKLAEISPRITVTEYGRTYQNRPLFLLTISSPENISNIETIKSQHQLLADPEKSGSLNLENMPAVVWMGYSVHGNEPSGVNAVPLVVYHLAAARGSEIDDLLKNTVILIDPCINPDGVNRFANWANTNRAKNPVADPNTREHREDWPYSRTNHYWFDLNRDWLLLQHPESQGRIVKFHEWLPNILTDHHEMGTNSTFFMQPGIPSRNNPLIPPQTYQLTGKIAEFHANALDQIGSLYYTKETFDDFYFGKGSTYPDLHGSIGILFEQASSRGLLQESTHGLLTFPFTIRNQLTTSLSTLAAARALRLELLENQRKFYQTAVEEAGKSDIQGYVFGEEFDAVRTHHFLDILLSHKIKVYQLKREFSPDNDSTIFRPEWSYLVPTNQPQYRLIRAIFERNLQFQDSLFYDVSSWTLPLAFNLPHTELRSGTKNYLGREMAQTDFPAGRFWRENELVAYAFNWDSYYAPRAANRLLQAGIQILGASRGFTAKTGKGDANFGRGTIIIPLGIQEQSRPLIETILSQSSMADGIDVHSIVQGLSLKGSDLGSPGFKYLKKPSVMLVSGAGVSLGQAGEIWHLLDQRMDIPVSLVDKRRINSVNLNRYNTIFMVNGSYSEIDSSTVDELKRWLQNGGTLIAVGSAAGWVSNKSLAKLNWAKTPEAEAPPPRRPYASKWYDRGSDRIGGAIFETILDLTHPLAYGYHSDKVAIFKRQSRFLQVSNDPYNTPLIFSDDPLLSGYIAANKLEQLKNSVEIQISSQGSGRIISIMDNLNFRAIWYGTNKILLNTIFFGNFIE